MVHSYKLVLFKVETSTHGEIIRQEILNYLNILDFFPELQPLPPSLLNFNFHEPNQFVILYEKR